VFARLFVYQVFLIHPQMQNNGAYVATGGDCGRLYVWNKLTGELVHKVQADKCIVNCVAAHFNAPVLAVSGLSVCISLLDLPITALLLQELTTPLNSSSTPARTALMQHSLSKPLPVHHMVTVRLRRMMTMTTTDCMHV
jgi:hypothetical protein